MTTASPRFATTLLLIVAWLAIYLLWLSVRPSENPSEIVPREPTSPTTVTTRFRLPPGFPKS